MTLDASFKVVASRFQALREAVASLHVTVVEDKPLTGTVALVDGLGNIMEDLVGLLEEAENAAGEGVREVEHPTDLSGARRSLVICQRQFNDFSYRFWSDLLSDERLAELITFGSERGGEWRAWSSTVAEGLRSCRQPVFDLDQALFLCWQELTERIGVNSVSVHATNIGQKIEVLEKKELVAEGVP